MLSKKFIKHRRLMTYALLAFITTTSLTFGITPASASEFQWQETTEQKWGGFTAPKINKFTDLPIVSLNTNFKPEQIAPTEDRKFKTCLSDLSCTAPEFFSNTWNKGQKILFNIFNPNPDVDLNPGVRFLVRPETNPDNPQQIRYKIKLPPQFPNNNPGSPYNLFRCIVGSSGISCKGIQWIEGETELPVYGYYTEWNTSTPGLEGVFIKSCFYLCVVADSSTINTTSGTLPAPLEPEPQPGIGIEPEPVRKLQIKLTCRASNGTITQVTKYSDTYLHSQGKTAQADLTCPSNTRIMQSKVYEQKYVNNNTWVYSPTTNINNEPGLIGVASYPPAIASPQNEDANCVIGQDICEPDIVVGSGNGAVSCFNNVSLCQDFKPVVVDPINNGTYNPQTSKYTCVYNYKIRAMEECKPIFDVVQANQSNISNNTPGNFKSFEDVKECAPAGLQILNPYAFAVSLGCTLEVLFIPSSNKFIEIIQQAYMTQTPLPQIVNLISGFINPITNAKTILSNNYCQGLDITIPLEITAWGATPGKSTTVFLFAACDGILKQVSDTWLPLANGVVYLSGFVIALNIYLRAWGLSLFFKGGTGIKVNP